MGEIRKEHDRNWFRPQFIIGFVFDSFDENFSNQEIRYELLNVEGVNAERGTTKVLSSTPEERQAVREMLLREIQNQFIDDNYIPYPRMTLIYPQPEDILSGEVTVQIEVMSLEMGEFNVELRINGGNWLDCAYNEDTKYYERTANTAPLANGEHSLEIKAQDGLGVLLELGPITVTVEN